MKKLTITAIVIALLDVFTFYCFITLDAKSNLTKQVKKLYCVPKEENNFDKELYIYVNQDNFAEKTEEFYEEIFDTKEDYEKNLNITKEYTKDIDSIRVEENEEELSYKVIQSSDINPKMSVDEIIYNLAKHECSYEEYY